MIEIVARTAINAPPEKVWDIISQVDNDKEYWHSMVRIRNIAKDQNTITREVLLGGDNKCRQRIMLFPKEGIHVKWLSGPIKGVKDMLLSPQGNTTVLEVQMNYRISGVVGLFSANASKQLQSEANLALEMIKEKAEGLQQMPALEERKLWADLIHEDI